MLEYLVLCSIHQVLHFCIAFKMILSLPTHTHTTLSWLEKVYIYQCKGECVVLMGCRKAGAFLCSTARTLWSPVVVEVWDRESKGGGARGLAPDSQNNQKSGFSNNAPSKFAMAVDDCVLGAQRLVCSTKQCPCISIFPAATYALRLRALEGCCVSSKCPSRVQD